MTEKQLREKLVEAAVSYYGCKESDGSHKKIIDLYNTQKPIPAGYTMKYTDAWCATFVSTAAIKAGLTDIIPTECSCERMISLYRSHKVSKWQENESITPQPGDVIFYDWQDSGVGDNTGLSDHVGIVVSVTGGTMKIIEGNMSNAVGYRNLAVNGKTIRGYGLPNFSSKATGATEPAPAPPASSGLTIVVGDIVNFTGSVHYTSAGAASGPACKPGKAKVTNTSLGAKHPYHLIAEKGGGSTVYGWVDAAAVTKVSTSTPAPAPATPAPAPTGDVLTLAVKYAAEIIYANEGSYGSVNKNDNGALSIGKVQWHASRALSLMKTIVKANLMQAQNTLGLALYNEILTAGASAWDKRIVDETEKSKISALLTTSEGKAAQDALAMTDITSYVKKGQSYGLCDCGALIYFADGVNQYGTGAALWKNIADAALKATGDVTAMWNATKALTDKYLARREKVYNAVLKLNLGGTSATAMPYKVRVTASSLNIRTGPGTTYGKNGSLANGSNGVITEEANGPDDTGKTIRWGKLQDGKGWIALMHTARL